MTGQNAARMSYIGTEANFFHLHRQTLAQLVLAYAKFDLTKALEASKKLPEFAAAEVDVNSLEEGAFLGAKKAKPASGALASPKPKTPGQKEEETLLLKKRKKKRKKRFPKNYNPDVDPDPERWLPRRERTGYVYIDLVSASIIP